MNAPTYLVPTLRKYEKILSEVPGYVAQVFVPHENDKHAFVGINVEVDDAFRVTLNLWNKPCGLEPLIRCNKTARVEHIPSIVAVFEAMEIIVNECQNISVDAES